MRKLFLAMAAMATLLTSCSKDETTTATLNQRAKVTFSVSAPELETRATEGDGLTATDLEYVIYDLAEESANGANQISGTAKFDDGQLTTNVKVDLVEGRTYEAIFFAKAPKSPYTFNKTEQNMTINTEKLMANAEEYDAFYKYVEPFIIKPTGNEFEVEMKRPFAQLNIAADDCDTDAGKMIDAATTGVELQAYTTLNFKDGTVSDKKTITYGLAERMDGEITANGESYEWLTMNYILVNSQELVDVEFFFTDEPNNGAENPLMRTYAKVPVERNHRTNIIGSILTNPTQFKVEIVPGFEDPEHVYDVDATEEIVVKTAADLQEAIDNAGEGTTVIKLDANITTQTTRAAAAAVTISQKEGVNLVIDGGGHTYNGTIYVDGNSRHTGTETLTFTDIKFTHSTGKIDFIWSDSADSTPRYAHNVTIENCTFTGNTNGAVVGVRFRQAYNIRFVNCVSGDNMFSLAQLTSTNGVTFDNVTITNNTEGINLLSSVRDATISNSNIKADLYGVRGQTSGQLTIENSSIEAKVPVIVRNNTSVFDVKLLGQNTLTPSDDNAYDVIFTAGAFANDNDFNNLSAPADDNYSITGADSYNVFPRDVVIATAADLAAFRDAVNAGTDYKGKVVKLADDIDLNNAEWTPIGGADSYANNFAGTFDGQGHTIKNLKVSNTSHAGLFGTMVGGVIKNLTIDGAQLTTNHYAGGIVAWDEAGGGSLTIENCHVKNAIITVSAEQKADGSWDNGDNAGGIIGFSYYNTIIGCSVENTTITAYRDCGGIVGYAEGGTVKNNTVKSGVKLIQDNSHNYKNYTTEEAVNFGDIIGRRGTATVTDGGNSGTVTKEGGIFDGYYISEGVVYNILNAKGFYNVATKILTDATKTVTVNLMDDIDLAGIEWPVVCTKAAFVLEGNNHSIKNFTTSAVEDHGFYSTAMFTSTRKATTIKNVVVDNAKVTGNGKDNSHGAVLVACNYADLTIEGVTVKNSSVSNCDRSAILTTYLYFTTAKVKDCVVEKCDIEGIGTCGAILGMNNSHNFEMTNNQVIDSTMSSFEGSNKAGIFIGTWQNAGTLTESGNTHSGSKAINAGEETNNEIGRYA